MRSAQFSALARFLQQNIRPQRRGAMIMDGKLALLYLIIGAMITFFYADDENFDRVKHAITAMTVPQVQAAAE
jgi:predicted membrane-bound mannosyltransferase